MKKKIMLCILATMMLTACGGASSDSGKTQKENTEEVTHVHTDEIWYSTEQQLIDDSKGIFEGRIKGSELMYIDFVEGKIVSEDDYDSDSAVYLCTVYDIEVTKTYRGKYEAGASARIQVLGDNKTVVFDQGAIFEEGKEYLFFTNYKDGFEIDWLKNSAQASYKIENGNYLSMDDSNKLEFDKTLLDTITNQ